MPICILHTIYFLNQNYFTMLLVSFTFKCKITPAQIPLIPFSVMHSINPVAADEPWPDHSALLRPGEEWKAQGNGRSGAPWKQQSQHYLKSNFSAWPHSHLTQMDWGKKATLPQLLLSQHLFWQAIIRAIEVLLSLFILLKCYNRSNNTFTFTLFFLSIQLKIL